MKSLLTFSIFTVLYTLNIQAQQSNDSLRINYNSKTIIINNGIRINNQLLRNTDLSIKMKEFEISNTHYQAYLKAKKPALLLPLAGVACIVGGAFLSRENNTAGTILISSSAIFTLSGSVFIRKANNQLNLAIWHYNREVLFPPKSLN